MELQDILETTREAIRECAGDDPDRWFYANRYVFARLQLDERKIKTGMKRRLVDLAQPCGYCGKLFESKVAIHLHRVDGQRGYSLDNCVLMHGECHQKFHAEHSEHERAGRPEGARASVHEGTLIKCSKRYDQGAFLYWWDISPNLAAALGEYDAVEFVKKDTGERCSLPPEALEGSLSSARQTNRGDGNWGIRVLKAHPDDLAFEPAKRGDEWVLLPVTWLSDEED